jgi:hypothetical protein
MYNPMGGVAVGLPVDQGGNHGREEMTMGLHCPKDNLLGQPVL